VKGVVPVKCRFHPRTKARAICSKCGAGLCGQCLIEDKGHVYCDNCFTSGDRRHGTAEADEAQEMESEDLIDLELMDMLDTDEDDGLF
jgi:uncharacterized Zn finger protein (UPF0148 family)